MHKMGSRNAPCIPQFPFFSKGQAPRFLFLKPCLLINALDVLWKCTKYALKIHQMCSRNAPCIFQFSRGVFFFPQGACPPDPHTPCLLILLIKCFEYALKMHQIGSRNAPCSPVSIFFQGASPQNIPLFKTLPTYIVDLNVLWKCTKCALEMLLIYQSFKKKSRGACPQTPHIPLFKTLPTYIVD